MISNTAQQELVKKKGNKILYFLMFGILLLSSLANSAVQDPALLLICALLLGGYVHTKMKPSFKIYLYGALMLVFYTAAITVIFGVSPGVANSVRYISYYLLGAYLVLIYGKTIFFYFEKVLFVLVIISLFFYLIELLDFDLLLGILTSLQNMMGIDIPETFKYKYYATIIIYTINTLSTAISDIRNSGFVFEPGYFAVLIEFALFFHIQLYRFSKKWQLGLYLLTILSTQSTTGLIGLGIIAFYFLLNLKSRYRLYSMFAASLIMLGGIYSPQGYEKVNDLFAGKRSTYDYMWMAEQNSDLTISMGRFVGLVFQVSEVIEKNPLVGFYGVESNRNISSIYGNLTSANGIGTFIFRFGFFGFVMLLIALYISSDIIVRRDWGQSYKLLFLLFFLTCLFSFPFINTAIFWIIVMYGWVSRTTESRRKLQQKELKTVQSFS